MSLQDAYRSTHRTSCHQGTHADDVVNQFHQVRLPQSSKKLSKVPNRACSTLHVVMANRKLSLSHNSRLEIETEIGSRSSQRNLAHQKCLNDLRCLRHGSGRSLHRATQSPPYRLPSEEVPSSFKFVSMLRSWLALLWCAKRFFSQKDHDRCGPSITLAMSSWLSGMCDFSQSSLRSFFFHTASFSSSAILKSFDRGLCRSTRRDCSHAKPTVDTALPAPPHICQRKLAAILLDLSRFFDYWNFDNKIFTLRFVLAFCGPFFFIEHQPRISQIYEHPKSMPTKLINYYL